MKTYVLKEKPEPPSNDVVWAFDLGKGSIGEAVRQGTKFLHKASLLIPAEFWKIKMGRAKRPVQELRLLSGLSFDLRSLADRFLRTADPQVLIWQN
ncbi:MAG TPA: hypothetical protein VIK28_01705 [Sedimentisphaerales bacterium]